MAKNTPGYLGPYRLLNVVHTGHASVIWQAYDDAQQRIVGVKTLLEMDRNKLDSEQVYYLHREYNIGQKIKHPQIIEIFPCQWDRHQPHFAMEWFSAPNLKQRLLQNGPNGLAPFLARIIDQASLALSHLHRLGWIHCDVKPDNFLMSDEGQLKLIDFALAKRRRRGLAKWLTRKSKIQGTKSYISPEQIRGAALDGRADLYSFACSIHELLSGKPPFTGINANDLLMKHLKSSPPPLESLNSNVTAEFCQLLRRCLAKNPDGRPETVDDFLREFRMMRVFRSNPLPISSKNHANGTDKP